MQGPLGGQGGSESFAAASTGGCPRRDPNAHRSGRQALARPPAQPPAPRARPASPPAVPAASPQLDVKSFSTAFNDGQMATSTFTVPADYAPPAGAPGAPTNLQAQVNGNEVQVRARGARGEGWFWSIAARAGRPAATWAAQGCLCAFTQPGQAPRPPSPTPSTNPRPNHPRNPPPAARVGPQRRAALLGDRV